MITKNDWLGIALREFPQFSNRWHEYQDEWAEHGGTPGVCTDADCFGEFVEELILEGPESEVIRAFRLIEHFLTFGDEDVDTAFTTCCLENMLNVTPSKLPAERFVPFLGPKSREYCRAWDQFTGVQTPGLWPEGRWPDP